ncbi:hypothetical protein SpCBS45565_g06162 [Spizellomyces sp. 'palustris']|nr:hypothetical protein SpCBS45565_g06162 [Spizellomyces sp. 'palustris']
MTDSNTAPGTPSEIPQPPTDPSPPVRTKTYFNHLLTVANKLAPYPVHKCLLHNVQHFFASPHSDPVASTPKHLRENPFDRIAYCINPNAKKAQERARLRIVLGASLLTQKYNDKPANIRMLFSKTPQGAAARATTRAIHRKMYGKGFFGFLKKKEKTWIESGDQFVSLIEKFGGGITDREPNTTDKEKNKNYASRSGPEYTYTLLQDGTLHFSRAESPVLDVASKHCIHSSVAEEVVYSGTFRLEDHDGEKVLVMDNDSGTYAPRTDRGELERLEALMQWNFKGLKVQARKFVPPGLE